jgi:hypothetical protein
MKSIIELFGGDLTLYPMVSSKQLPLNLFQHSKSTMHALVGSSTAHYHCTHQMTMGSLRTNPNTRNYRLNTLLGFLRNFCDKETIAQSVNDLRKISKNITP